MRVGYLKAHFKSYHGIRSPSWLCQFRDILLSEVSSGFVPNSGLQGSQVGPEYLDRAGRYRNHNGPEIYASHFAVLTGERRCDNGKRENTSPQSETAQRKKKLKAVSFILQTFCEPSIIHGTITPLSTQTRTKTLCLSADWESNHACLLH
ncbi:hypothetical protein CBL_08169 [Carabus blaptoides fortunei]